MKKLSFSIKLLINLFIFIRVKTEISSSDLEILTRKIDVNLYKENTKNQNPEDIRLNEESNKKTIYNQSNVESILNNKISQSKIDILRFNWELGNTQIKKEVHWILFLLIFNVEKYINKPKNTRLIKNYNECLIFVKFNIKLFANGVKDSDRVELIQRACIIFIDSNWKITSKWNNINNMEYLELSRQIISSELYLKWRELYKIDPARSQWFILNKIASNKWDEILRLLKVLTKDKEEYKSIENILTEFMTQSSSFDNSYSDDYKLKNKLYNNKFHELFKNRNNRKIKKSRKTLMVYLPQNMPDLYVYHHQVETCVLNLSIMSLYPELKVYFYDVFTRTPTYYIFHRKSIAVSRKTLLRSNQICHLMFEATRRLERSYYLLKLNIKTLRINELTVNDTNKSSHILEMNYNYENNLKPLPFHPFYYSTPSDINLETFYINWLLNFEVKEKTIKDFLDYSKSLADKYKNLLLKVKWELRKKSDELLVGAEYKKSKYDYLDYASFYEEIELSNEIINENIGVLINNINSMNSSYFDIKNDMKPTFSSLIPLLYVNSKLWDTQRLWYKYPVSVTINLDRILILSNDIRIRERKLNEIEVVEISTCIKIITILWKHDGLKVNNRSFRILDSKNEQEMYEKSKGITKIYQDYATIYLLCVKTVSQSIIYYRRFLKYKLMEIYQNDWRLNKLYDMTDEFSSNSFQFINKKNVNLHSLPNDFILPKLTKSVYISILTGYVLLSVGALCIQTLITILV